MPTALSLLAFLAVEANRPHHRGSLAALFWPEQPQKQAFQNLRQLLARLRRGLGDSPRSGTRARPGPANPPHLLVSRETIQFNRQSDYWLDVDGFQQLISRTGSHPHRRLDVCVSCKEQLAKAASLYRGDFLSGVHGSASLALDEWLLIERERLQAQACSALLVLAGAHLAHREPEATIRYVRRLLDFDPWNEAAQRLLLRALVLIEGRHAALGSFEAFRQALADELGLEPEHQTLDLVKEIQEGAPANPQVAFPAGYLPAPSTRLVGRDTEQRQIAQCLAAKRRRLITLHGPGGCGKTRLALELAASEAPLWRDGVWFVRLEEVEDPQGMKEALASSLGLKPPVGTLETEHLVGFLRRKELLLILDSFEHLVASAPILADILRWAPEVKILVTSRNRLGVRGEWAIPLGGLKLPPAELASTADAEGSSAVQLFELCARRVSPTFRLTGENVPHVTRICRLVQGLPLGIELAAAWIRLYPCRRIADEIQESTDFLQAPGRSIPQRHQSLRGMFDHTYNLLPEAKRARFRRLAVFRGGFGVEAARQVTGASPRDLDSLLDKSLLRVRGLKPDSLRGSFPWAPGEHAAGEHAAGEHAAGEHAGGEHAAGEHAGVGIDQSARNWQGRPERRLDLHLLLQEYAEERLAENPQDEADTRGRHSRFYLNYLQAREGELFGEHSREACDQILEVIDNARAAWRWAVAHGQWRQIGACEAALRKYCDIQGIFGEAEVLFASAAQAAQGHSLSGDGAGVAAARLLASQTLFLLRCGRLPDAAEAAGSAVAAAQRASDRVTEARARSLWGSVLTNMGESQAALQQFEESLSLLRAEPALSGLELAAAQASEAVTLSSYAVCLWRLRESDRAREMWEEALAASVRDGNRLLELQVLGNLGILAKHEGRYDDALAHYERSMDLARRMRLRHSEGTKHSNLGSAYYALGNYDRARRQFEQAVALHRKSGMRDREALGMANLALVYHSVGEDAAARHFCLQAIAILEQSGERRYQSAVWMKLGHANAGLGRFDESADAYSRSVVMRRELGWVNEVMEPLAGLARVAMARDRDGEARQYVHEILDHLASGGTLLGTISPFQIYLTCYRFLVAGLDPRAGDILQTAYNLLQKRAAAINNLELRHSFLENVPAHKELVEAYAEATCVE